MKINSEHIQSIIKSGGACLVDAKVASAFSDYLEKMPWKFSGTGLDWDTVGGVAMEVEKISSLASNKYSCRVALSEDSHIVFWFNPMEPCLACEINFALAHMDYIFWKNPGRGYFFGAVINNNEIVPFFEHFAEYDGMDKVFFKSR